MPSKHISHSANTSNPFSNCPHALTTHVTQCQHLKTPFSIAAMPSKHFSPSVDSPHTRRTHFTQCQHLKPPLQLLPCPQNPVHRTATPPTPISTAPMPSKHVSPSANTSNPLFNCPHGLKPYLTQCGHLKPPFQLPPCPQNMFHSVPTPQTPFSTAPSLSNHISPNANTSNPLFNCPHPLKTHVTQCQHLRPPLQLPPCPQNMFHSMPTPQTPSSTPPVPSKHISPSSNTSNPLFNPPHAV